MRSRKIMAISAVLAVLLIAFAVMAFGEPERLSISIGSVEYKGDRGLIAAFTVTNTSNCSIRYSTTYLKLGVLGDHDWRISTNEIDFGLPVPVLEPGETTTNWISLPHDVRRWKVAYEVQTPSAQLKLWKKLPWKISARSWRVISKYVSGEPGEVQVVWSNEIDLQNWRDTHPKELLRAKNSQFMILRPSP